MFGFCKNNPSETSGGILASTPIRGAIPDLATCVQLMDEYQMLDNIRQHSLMVAMVADTMLLELLDDPAGAYAPARRLVLAGSLLHDIAKTQCLDGSCDHAQVGGEICRSLGYPDVAAIVEEHVVLKEYKPEHHKRAQFTAREIVYYADKRIRHEQVVSLDERLEYILERYGNNDPERYRLIRENFDRCQDLEQALFTFLPFKVEELEHRIRFPQYPDKMLDDPWS